MTSDPLLSIVMVNFNQAPVSADCLNSLKRNPPQCDHEIVLVDNASTDHSADWLEQNYPSVKLVRSASNLGIAGGNNLGLRASRGRYALLLNNDTQVLPGAIDLAIGFLESHPEAGGVGGQLQNEDGSFQSSFFDFPSIWQLFLVVSRLGQLFRSYYPSYPPASDVTEVNWLSTAFMAFRRDALDQVGLVDQEFFIYCDETDLQYRLKEIGWKLYYHPSIRTIHLGGRSLTPWRRRRMVYRGYLLFFDKHYGTAQSYLLRALFTAVCALKLPFWLAGSVLPAWSTRSKLEVSSNLDILQMCVQGNLSRVV